jgi:mono/diheme cytochrome c family protein
LTRSDDSSSTARGPAESPVHAQANVQGVDQTFRAEDTPTEQVDVEQLHAPIMREKQEPRDGYEPVPLWLVAVFGALVFWGGWYLATYSGGFRSDVLDEEPSARYAGGAVEGATEVDPLVLGQRLYQANCVACHGVTGAGQPGVYPPLAGSQWVAGSAARVVRIVLHGLEGPIVVSGSRYNNSMPAFGARLSDQHLAAVLTYIRTNGEWGNSATPITPAQVTAARAATSKRRTAWSEAELLAINVEDLPSQPAAPVSTAPAPNTPGP